MDINYKDIEASLINFRRDLHQIPELSFDLPKTTAYVKNTLDQIGIEYEELLNGSAIVATIKGKGKGKIIGLRADMDALPIKEETGLSFSSKNGNMHACGHDAHTAMLLASGKILNEIKDSFTGQVKLFFQPAEESGGGAKPMIQAGILDNPKVDFVLGQHVISAPGSEVPGMIHFTKGPMLASNDAFKIRFIGKGGHGAQPHTSIDPITMSSLAINAFQTMLMREIDPLEDKVFTIGKINGGSAINIIPDTVEIEGTLRTFNEDVRKLIKNRVKDIACGIASSMGGKAEVDFIEGYPTLINDSDLADKLIENSIRVFGEDKIDPEGKKLMGSEDFAYFGQKVPSLFTFIDMPKHNQDGCLYPSHSSKFDIDESQLINGVKYFVESTIFLLNN